MCKQDENEVIGAVVEAHAGQEIRKGFWRPRAAFRREPAHLFCNLTPYMSFAYQILEN